MAQSPVTPPTYNSATKDYSLGQEYWTDYNGERCLFRYVLIADSPGVVKGDVVMPASASSNVVTRAYTGGSAVAARAVVGVAVGTITHTQYGFVMVKGIHDAVKCATSVAANDFLMAPNATAGTAAEPASAATPAAPVEAEWFTGMGVFGIALGSGSGGTCPARINCL